MFRILISPASGGRLSPSLLDSMHVLRGVVFSERLHWDVHCHDGRERDSFDDLDPLYLIAHDGQASNQAIGCWRLLPCTGPYMLRDVFPGLLGAHAPPHDPHTWEISRFAVDASYTDGAFGFSELPARMLRELVLYAGSNHIDTVAGVTSTAVERMLRRLGFQVDRYAEPQRIGRVMSVAFRLPMTVEMQRRVCGERDAGCLDQAA